MYENGKEHDESKVFSVPKPKYGDKYEEHLLQQYLLYVQMADNVSERRLVANTFFLTANTAILSALGVVAAIYSSQQVAQGVLVFIASLTPALLCYAWFRIVKSYQQLNSGKFVVIHEIEKRLPLALYDAEWVALGKGTDPSKYKPLTDVEKWVPVIFILLYVVIAIVALSRS
jgi:hypothetical protein